MVIYWNRWHDLKTVKERLRDVDGVKVSRVILYSVILHHRYPEIDPWKTHKKEFLTSPNVLSSKLGRH